MIPMYTTIGEHCVELVCRSERLLAGLKKSFRFSFSSSRKPDLFVQVNEGYGVPFVDDHVEITKQGGVISYARADYLLETESDYVHSEISAYNELALKHALMNLYSAYLIHHEWGLLLHSSCVVDRGRAVVFAGPSGAGKSTAAQLSQPRELLSDEATLVRITPRKITVYDSPFRSELHGVPDQPVCPLSSIQLLKQSPINLRNPISKPSALLQLTDKVFYWAHDAEETRKAFSLLVTLTEAVPVYELFFQKNDTFWELIS